MEQRGLGNLAAAVSQIRTTEAMNQLEAQNQAIKRQSLGQYASLAGQMQSIQNQNIQSFNQMLYAQQQALGQAAQAGFKNLAGTGATIAEAIEGKEAIDDETIKDPVTTGQMGVTDTTAMPSVTSDSLLPTQDISEAPAIPSGAGSPGITSTSVLGPDGLPMQAPTQTSFQLPTETLGTPEIPSFELYLQPNKHGKRTIRKSFKYRHRSLFRGRYDPLQTDARQKDGET
jgi:hypothetical protein